MRSYYGKRTPGQMRGVVSRPAVGLDEYEHPISVNDNYITDMLDAQPLNNEATRLEVESLVDGGLLFENANNAGRLHQIIAVEENKYIGITRDIDDGIWYSNKVDTSSNLIYKNRIKDAELPGGNLINDGNFEDYDLFLATDSGTDYTWNASNATNVYYKDGVCYFTATAQHGGVSQGIPLVSGRKYFLITDAPGLTYVLDGFVTNIVDPIPSPGYSWVVVTAAATEVLYIRAKDPAASGWTEKSVSYAMAIDVTHETTLTDNQILSKYRAGGYVASGDGTSDIYSSCIFSTEAKQYACFTSSVSKKLIYVDISKDSYTGSILDNPVDLPFYPKKIVSIHNRIFAIDTGNTLWWCRAGDFFSWYSREYDDNAIVTQTDMIVGAYTIAAQPDITRPITMTTQIIGTGDTLGTVLITGTNELDQVITEELTPTYGRVQTLKSFKTVTSIVGSDWVIGGTADKIEFGTAPASGGFVQNDAGFWTIEREQFLSDICVISNNLHIYAPDNIYVMRGYSPDTFTLGQAIAGIGIPLYQGQRKMQVTIENVSYFISNKNVYQFNGYDYPRLISHKEMTNGAVTNGIMGGIKEFGATPLYSISADEENLHIYDSSVSAFATNEIYVYNTNAKTWWIRSGFTINNSIYSAKTFNLIYTPTLDGQGTVAFINIYTDNYFDAYDIIGHKGTVNPYMITKAFNSSPSDIGSLTSVILQVKGTADATTTLTLSYSLTSEGNDFITIKDYVGFRFTGDIQNIELPVPTAYIINAHHYRLKIESSNTIDIYNIERRFRVRGMIR